MATIKLKNDKVILKDGKVSCACCACQGCGSLKEILNLTAVNGTAIIGTTETVTLSSNFSLVEPFTNRSQGACGEGEVGYCENYVSLLCGFSGQRYSQGGLIQYNQVFSVGVTKVGENCVAIISAGWSYADGPNFGFANGSIQVPPSDLMGTHTFVLAGWYVNAGADPVPITSSATVTIT